MYQCRTMLEDTCTREQARLRKESAEVHALADAHCVWFQENMPFSVATDKSNNHGTKNIGSHNSPLRDSKMPSLHTLPDPDIAYALIDSQWFAPLVLEGDTTTPCLITINARLRALQQQEELFDLKMTRHEGLERCSSHLVKLKHAWDFVSLVNAAFEKWTELAWQVN
jgi:hypothetical protein